MPFFSNVYKSLSIIFFIILGGVWIYQHSEKLMEEELFDISQILKEDDTEVVFSKDPESSEVYGSSKKGIYDSEDEDEEMKYFETEVPASEDNDETHFDHSERLSETRELTEIKYRFMEQCSSKPENDHVYDVADNDRIRDIENTGYEKEFTVIKYTEPVIMEDSHGQYVFQQIEMKAPERTNAYDITMKAEKELGIKSEFSKDFGSFYVNEINGIKDGQNGMWWEFYIRKPDGSIKIGQDSIDKVSLNPGETIQWRLASEEPGGCGGGSGSGNGFIKDIYRGKSSNTIRQPYTMINSGHNLLYN